MVRRHKFNKDSFSRKVAWADAEGGKAAAGVEGLWKGWGLGLWGGGLWVEG